MTNTVRTKNFEFPVVELSNGVRVCNFSSPHEFKFVDGSVLPAVSEEMTKALSVKERAIVEDKKKFKVLRKSFELTNIVFETLQELENNEKIDIILVSLITLTALKEAGVTFKKCYTVNISDRVSKLVDIDKFCTL